MGATQGVILLMMGALALYLMWNAKSPFNKGTGSGSGGSTVPPSNDTPPPSGVIPPGPGSWVAPWLPPEARTCADHGGHWNMFTGKCDMPGTTPTINR